MGGGGGGNQWWLYSRGVQCSQPALVPTVCKQQSDWDPTVLSQPLHGLTELQPKQPDSCPVLLTRPDSCPVLFLPSFLTAFHCINTFRAELVFVAYMHLHLQQAKVGAKCVVRTVHYS